MSFPTFKLEFTKDGSVHDETQVDEILKNIDQFSDLLVISHGWNNDMQEAQKLYDDLGNSIEKILQIVEKGENLKELKELKQRKFGVVHVFWPSKRFADKDLIPGGGAASATQASDDALIRLLEALKRDPERLPEKAVDSKPDLERAAILARVQAVIPRLETDQDAQREYVLELRKLFVSPSGDVDDGTDELFTQDPVKLFDSLKEPVKAPVGSRKGGATSISDAGGAAGLGDLVASAKAAARRIANLFTYSTMKERAGTVGREGLSPVLVRLRGRKEKLKLHLVGHSFGGRLVTAAADALLPGTPDVSLTLLQAAYSHNGLSKNFDDEGNNGAFRSLIADKRASGPVVITHTHNDKAVGIAYPLASRISRDQASALGDKDDPYGGMGRNGAQHTPEAEGKGGDMHGVGKPYDFQRGSVYNLKADDFIDDHGDVTGFEVAYALLHAVKAV